MILSQVLAYARAQALTDSNGLTDANGIVFANEANSDFHRKLINAGVDASQIQESYRDGAVNTGTYLYPTDMLFLKGIELNYTNTTAENYKTAEQLDVSNLPNKVSFSWLRKNADKNKPNFDDRGDWFEIFPTPTSADNVSQMMRIMYYLRPNEYGATTDTVSYPENMDATILGWRIAANYLYSLSNIADGDKFNLKYEERVKQYVATLGRGVQQPTQAKALQITGWQF